MNTAQIIKEYSKKEDAIKFLKTILKINEDDTLPNSNSGSSGWISAENLISSQTFRVEDQNFMYNYCLAEYTDKFVISKLVIFKHPLVKAVEESNYEDFLFEFNNNKNYQSAINLAFEISVKNDFTPVYNYLIVNRKNLTNDPVYRCIYYDNPSALILLLNHGYEMKSSWLIQAVDYNSKKIIDEFVFKQMFPTKETLNSGYFSGRYSNYKHSNKNELTEFLKKNYNYNG